MTEQLPEEEVLEPADYDLDEQDANVVPVPATEALPYPDVDQHDDVSTDARALTSLLQRSPEEAIQFGRSWALSGHWVGVGRCLATVRVFFNIPSKYGTATESWTHADHKHPVSRGTDVPRGAPVYWTGGSRGFGHVALSVGGGLCLSTDWKREGRVDYARIDEITSHWNLNFAGYANEINDVQAWKPALTHAGPVIHLSRVLPRKRNDDILRLKKRLREKGYKGFITSSRYFGKGTRKAYAAYQRRLGYTGHDANGVPGKVSLRKLGFTVKP